MGKRFKNGKSNILNICFFILFVFLCEAFAMASMSFLFKLSFWGAIFIDSCLLVILLLPGFYFFLYRPMDRQIQERRRVIEALGEQEKKYRLMMEAMHDPVYICSADYRVIYMNPAMIRRTGREAVGGLCHKWIHGRERICPWCMNDKIQRGEYAEYEVVSPADGRFYNVAQCPIFYLDGRIDKMVILRDLTRYKEIEEKLRKAGDKLEERVVERTAMLQKTNMMLSQKITDHKTAEEALQQSEEQLRRLGRKLLTSQEEERRLIARELHDGIGQTLSAIKFKVETALKELEGKEGSESCQVLGTVVPMIQGAVEEVRRISKNLRPPILDDLGVVATISWFTREFMKIYDEIQVDQEIQLKEEDVPQPLKVSIFRVLQEAFNNVAKHSQADLVRVTLKKRDGWIDLVIEDNGRGFDIKAANRSEDPASGLGLAGMKERAILSVGSFELESFPGKGTRIAVSLPCPAKVSVQ